MRARPRHTIRDVEVGPGTLSFDAKLEGIAARRVNFRLPEEVTPGTQGLLPTVLLPAMRHGGLLQVDHPLSPKLLRSMPDFQAIQRVWSRDWPFGHPPLEPVEIQAPARGSARREPTGRVAAFFSGGVDSWWTILSEPGITDLIFVRGFDLEHPHSSDQRRLTDEVEARLRAVAGEIGLPLHVVETDLRWLVDPLLRWEAYYSAAASAVALLFESVFDRVLISADADHETQAPIGSAQLIDQLWTTEAMEIVDVGGTLNREDKLRQIAGHRLVRKSLRVCWRNTDGAYNCCRCRKCLITMISLETMGTLAEFETFPHPLDLSLFEGFEIDQMIALSIWEDALDTVRAAGRGDLERPVADLVARGRRTLELSPFYRTRKVPGPPPIEQRHEEQSAGASQFFATAETAAMLREARFAALLVGGYDGSGNYGDLAQLDRTLELLEKLETPLLALPVLELAHRGSHTDLVGAFRNRFPVLYFEPGAEKSPDLVPVELPQELRFTLCLLYGGGYLNRFWGERKLQTLRAVEALVAGSAHICRIVDATQAEAEWIEGLDADNLRRLRSFELLGARDSASAAALSRIGSSAPVLETGDAVVGLLGSPPPTSLAPKPTVIAVHFAEHDFVTETKGPLLRFYVDLLGELQQRVGEHLTVQPLIAYLDRRVDERPGIAELRTACAQRDVELLEPIRLTPAGIAEQAAKLQRAALTLSCSYHVALTSLLLGIPTVLIEDRPYYGQKAAGLREVFSSPLAGPVDTAEDPAEVAEALSSTILDASRAAELQAALRIEGEGLRRRRSEAETEIMARVAGSALAAAAGIAAPARADAVDAEERLADLLNSRSWRLTEPLRQAAAKLRSRRSNRRGS